MCILPLKGMMLCGGGGKRLQREGLALKKINQNKQSGLSHSHQLAESTFILGANEVIHFLLKSYKQTV